MRTLYVDVYFLLNFSVDLLALYFSAVLTGFSKSGKRLILSALIGAAFACLSTVLSPPAAVGILCAAASLVLMIVVATRGAGWNRRVRFGTSFLLFSVLLGGLVTLLYRFLDRVLPKDFFGESVIDRKFLRFAVVTLLALGVLKLGEGLLRGVRSERSVSLTVDFGESSVTLDALVDTGNLLTDPASGAPVMLVKEKSLAPAFPGGLSDEVLGKSGRLRLIPASTPAGERVFSGVRPDAVLIERKRGRAKVRVVIAIDREEGTFGGYAALLPGAALNDV